MKRWICSLLAILLLALPLQGCWNYRETETLNIVAGFAVDKGTEGYRYHLTMDIANTSNAGKDKPVVTTLIESEGNTLFEAVRNALIKTGVRLFWENCQIGIISKDVASESILPVVDFLLRDSEPRLTIELFVSEEQTAKEILHEKPATLSIVSFEIDRLYEMNEKEEPTAAYQVLYEEYNMMAGKGRALTLPALKMVDNAGEKTAQLDGMAIFKGDRLKGFLNSEDSKYALYAMDHAKGGALEVKATTGNTIAALEVFSNKTSMFPQVQGDKVGFQVHTETDASIDEQDSIADIAGKEQRNGFEAAAEAQLQSNIERVVRQVQQEFGLDIFGFGDELQRKEPDVWNKLEKNWNDVFRSMPVDVSCKINIRNSSFNIEPPKVGQR